MIINPNASNMNTIGEFTSRNIETSIRGGTKPKKISSRPNTFLLLFLFPRKIKTYTVSPKNNKDKIIEYTISKHNTSPESNRVSRCAFKYKRGIILSQIQ